MSWNGPSPLTLRVIPVLSTIAPVPGSAIDFSHSVIYVVRVVFCAAGLRKFCSCCWKRAKREYDATPFSTVHSITGSHRSPYDVWGMSALGQKRTSYGRSGMSALPPSADRFSVGATPSIMISRRW
jgi:hypothetical protein